MKNTHKIIVLWFCLGVVYYSLEGFFHLFTNGGWANVLMLPIGGFCCVAVGAINQAPVFYKLNILFQSLIGAVVVTVVEFISGCVLNLWLGLGIWDYSKFPLNCKGQICLLFSFAWFFLMPLAIWLEDFFRLKLWNEGEYYSLGDIYKELFGIKVNR